MKGKSPSLASQDEYQYFRNRYPRESQTEWAFLILTDATIRRWCGPQSRIGNARRTRAAAALADLQAAHLDELARRKIKEGMPQNEIVPELGSVRLTPAGPLSAIWGTLDFLTPISEMPISKVTPEEADSDDRWRNLYQSNWRAYF